MTNINSGCNMHFCYFSVVLVFSCKKIVYLQIAKFKVKKHEKITTIASRADNVIIG